MTRSEWRTLGDTWSLSEQVRTRQVTATELVERFLSKVSTPRQKEINAFAHVDAVGARQAARHVDQSIREERIPGPLSGVPFGVKELQEVKGWPNTLASEAFADRIGESTDTIVSRLVAAGAIPVGLTTSPELGRSSFCSTPLHGTTRNPWDNSLTTGGSSSGSAAAVASGLTAFSTGSDGAGSLRIPASFCGVVGFKPSAGVVPRGPKYGGAAGNQAYGPIASSVRDVALLMDVLSGVDDGEYGSVPAPGSFVDALASCPSGLRVGFSPGLGISPVEPDVQELCEAAFAEFVRAIDGDVVDVEPDIVLPDSTKAFRVLSMLDVHTEVRGLSVERSRLLGESVRQYSELVEQCSFDDYSDAHVTRAELIRAVAVIFDRIDILVTPTTPTRAFAAEGPMPHQIDGSPVDHWGSLRLTYPFNLTGHPAVSVPVPVTAGPPVGLQLIARRFNDPLLISAAARYELATAWPRHAPEARVST